MRGGTIDRATTGFTAGEGHLGHIRVRDERLADVVTEARYNIDHAGRESSLFNQLGKRERRCRGMLGGLEDNRVARRQGRRDLPRREQQRRIPWRDRDHDAQWLQACVCECPGPIDRHYGAHHFVSQATEEVVPLRQVAHLRPHLNDQLAVVVCLDLRELICVPGDEIAQPAQ